MAAERPILVAGGGPVGVITALALARQGLPVHVFEAEARINDMPRAATTHAATLEMLAGLGMVDEVIERGFVEPLFRIWDRPSKQIIAEFDFGMLTDDTPYPFVVQCEQHKLATMAIERLKAFPHATVEFSARVTALEQFGDRVEIEVESAERHAQDRRLLPDRHRRRALDRAQGARHRVRGLHPSGAVPDPDHDRRSRRSSYPGCTRNYISDPDEWFALFKVSGDERGRCGACCLDQARQTDDELMNPDATERRLQKFFPKHGAYDIVHRNLYNVHQRVAASFRKGRVFLAGDSAHVNNPLGGLGLNFGVHDAMELDAARPRDPPRGAAKASSTNTTCTAAAERRIRAAADDRQQEAPGREGPGRAREKLRPATGDGGRPGGAPQLSVARIADRERQEARRPWRRRASRVRTAHPAIARHPDHSQCLQQIRVVALPLSGSGPRHNSTRRQERHIRKWLAAELGLFGTMRRFSFRLRAPSSGTHCGSPMPG